MLQYLGFNKNIGVIWIVEVEREGCTDFCVQGSHNLGRILVSILIKNIMSPSESRDVQVPPVAEYMSMQWSHERHKSGAGKLVYGHVWGYNVTDCLDLKN